LVRLGISTLFCLSKPLPDAIKRLEHLNRIGVSHVEVVDDGPHELSVRRVGMLRRAFLDRNISLSVHAPFTDINIASISPVIRSAVMKRLRKSIEISVQLDPECWVFHPGIRSAIGDALKGLDWKINLKSTCELLDLAGKYGLRIAIENVPDPFPFLLKRVEDFERFYGVLNAYGSELGIAFDIGHAHINGQVDKFIERFGSRIIHIHVHDNDGSADTHLGIGFGSIDWADVIRAIKEINYRGALVIESKDNIEGSIQTLKRLI